MIVEANIVVIRTLGLIMYVSAILAFIALGVHTGVGFIFNLYYTSIRHGMTSS